MSINIYVDGSPGKKGEQGWSGWGLCAMDGDRIFARACGVSTCKESTNAMELEALIRGIGFAADRRLQATVWVDSIYTAKAFSQALLLYGAEFKRKGKLIPNADRIELLYELLYELGWLNLVECRWTKGHKNIIGNEEADRLSKLAAYAGTTMLQEGDDLEPPTEKK
jgi:ribonuclease HI